MKLVENVYKNVQEIQGRFNAFRKLVCVKITCTIYDHLNVGRYAAIQNTLSLTMLQIFTAMD